MATIGRRSGSSTACGPPAASGRQARSDRQRVPRAGRAPQRRRPRRLSSAARRPAHQPRHRLPHAAVDGRRRHRPQGRLRRRPLPLRALLPASAPLPPDLQDLQPLVRVPELRHRGAHRGSGGGARLHGAPERRADLRHVRGRAARAGRRGRRRPPASCCSRATRCASPSPPSAAASSSTRAPRAHEGPARPQDLREAGRRKRRHHLGDARGALPGAAERIRSSSRGRRSCSSRARPTASSPRAPSSCARRRGRPGGAADRHPLRARLAPVLQALRRAVRGLRRQADLPRVRRRGARAPRPADSRVPRARQAPAREHAGAARARAARAPRRSSRLPAPTPTPDRDRPPPPHDRLRRRGSPATSCARVAAGAPTFAVTDHDTVAAFAEGGARARGAGSASCPASRSRRSTTAATCTCSATSSTSSSPALAAFLERQRALRVDRVRGHRRAARGARRAGGRRAGSCPRPRGPGRRWAARDWRGRSSRPGTCARCRRPSTVLAEGRPAFVPRTGVPPRSCTSSTGGRHGVDGAPGGDPRDDLIAALAAGASTPSRSSTPITRRTRAGLSRDGRAPRPGGERRLRLPRRRPRGAAGTPAPRHLGASRCRRRRCALEATARDRQIADERFAASPSCRCRSVKDYQSLRPLRMRALTVAPATA